MNDEPAYMDMLSVYPYYQEILDKRQREVQRAKKLKAIAEKNEKPILYKFEERLGRSNLAKTIDIEALDRSKVDRDKEEYKKYE